MEGCLIKYKYFVVSYKLFIILCLFFRFVAVMYCDSCDLQAELNCNKQTYPVLFSVFTK